MDLQTSCNACFSVNRRPSRLGPSLNQKFIAMPLNSRRKLVSQLQSSVPVDGSIAQSPTVPTHKVTVHDRQRGVVHKFSVAEDQYILHTAESQSISLPFACRHGCCTSCAVRVMTGKLRQPEALGISAELKDKACYLLDGLRGTHFFVWASHHLTWRLKHKMRMRCIGFNLDDILQEGLLKEMIMH